jgi:hypothetical protein
MARESHHVEGIGSQSKRMSEETGDKFKEEERRVNDDHHLDPGTLGPHLGIGPEAANRARKARAMVGPTP